MTEPVAALDAHRAPRARHDVAVAVVDGAAVIHHRGRVHTLDPVATLVWQCCDGEVPVAVLAAELADAFGTAPGAVGRDVATVVAELAVLDLLEPAPGDVRPATGDGVDLLVDPPGACAACAEREWPARLTFRVGRRLVAVGLDGPGAVETATAALGDHLVAPPPALVAQPPFLGVELHDRARRAEVQRLDLLLRAETVTVRSRHAARVFRALAAHLASYGDLAALGLAAVPAAVVGRGDRVLLVAEPDDPVRFARALDREHLMVADQPVALVDPATAEVVVGAPGVSFDSRVVDAVPGAAPDRVPEPPALPWGRYRIEGIAVPAPARASSALLACGPRVDDRRDHDATVDALLALFDTVPVVDAVTAGEIGARLAS